MIGSSDCVFDNDEKAMERPFCPLLFWRPSWFCPAVARRSSASFGGG